MIRPILGAVLAAFFFLGAAASAQTLPHTALLVVGGTPAGVAAAVSAARRGVDVTLVAARPQLGGVLTDAMMVQWDLNLGPTGASVEGGLFAEIHGQLGDSFTPQAAAGVFGNLVAREPRIHLIRRATAIAARTSAAGAIRLVNDVTFRRDNGRVFDIAADEVIDATDNGDVAADAGATFDVGRQDTGRDERMQAVTLMFTIDGVDWHHLAASYDPRVDGAGGTVDTRAWGYAKLMSAYQPRSSDVLVRDLNLGHENGGAITVNAIDILDIDGRSPSELARARSLAIDEAPRLLVFLRTHLAGFAHATIGRYADRIYVRETRHFAGLERLIASDVWDGRVPADTIGLSSYPLDLHPSMADERAAFAPIRHVYGIPFGSLVPRGFANLLIASPAISASHIASGSARVIPTTIEEGEAGGAAVAEALAQHLPVATIAAHRSALAALQADLRRHGAIIPATRDAASAT